MIEWLKSKFRGNHNAPAKTESAIDLLPSTAAGIGSQQSIETESGLFLSFLTESGLGWIYHPWNLQENLTLYLTDSLSKMLVDTEANLICSEFEYCSPNDKVNDYLREFNVRLQMGDVVKSMAHDISWAGFTVHEIIGDKGSLENSDRILALKRLDPRFMVCRKNKYGRIIIWGERMAPQGMMPFPQSNNLSYSINIELDPESVVYAHSHSPFSSYGHPSLQSVKTRLRQRMDLIAATVRSHENHSNPLIHLWYIASLERNEGQDGVDRQIQGLMKMAKESDEKRKRWLVSGGLGEYGAETLGPTSIPDATNILHDLTIDIICSCGFSPSVFGLQSVKDIDSSRIALEGILTKQRLIMASLTASLYSRLPFLESDCPANDPSDIIIRLKPPTEETIAERAQAEAVLLNNAQIKLRSGLWSPEKFAAALGESSIYDKEKLANFINTSEKEEPNANDPNSTQQITAVNDRLSAGNPPGNNPSGTSGDATNDDD